MAYGDSICKYTYYLLTPQVRASARVPVCKLPGPPMEGATNNVCIVCCKFLVHAKVPALNPEP